MTPRIAFFNRFFERWPSEEELGPARLPPLFGPRHAEQADAVVFHLPTLSADFFRHREKPEGLPLGFQVPEMQTTLVSPGIEIEGLVAIGV